MQTKANPTDMLGRFREIVSDPLNLLIERHPSAGTVENNYVYLHNGNKVPLSGPCAYYGDFSLILVINRGVHEPLEEYVFQELLKILPNAPIMIELGAYWGHYSMWLKKLRPKASVFMVEPDKTNMQAGLHNFAQHGYEGEYVQSFVGKGHFEVDTYLTSKNLLKLNILHADIQGYEVEMLDGCSDALHKKSIDYIFISTHSQELHNNVINKLISFKYRIEVSSDFDSETTSYDGFIFASSPLIKAVFQNFSPFSRKHILASRSVDLVKGLVEIFNSNQL